MTGEHGSGIPVKQAEKRLTAMLLCEEEILLVGIMARRELDKSTDGKEPGHALTLAEKAEKALDVLRARAR